MELKTYHHPIATVDYLFEWLNISMEQFVDFLAFSAPNIIVNFP